MLSYKIFFLIGIVAWIGCSTPSMVTQINKQPVTPNNFSSSDTSISKDSILWDQISNDSILNGLIDTAIQNNNEIQVAFQKIELARSQRQFTKGSLLPQIGIGTSGSVRKFGLYTMDGAGNIVTEITPGRFIPIDLPDMYLGIQSSWEIDLRGRLKNLDKAALARFFASQEGLKFVISSLATDVALSYYELLALDNELIVIRENAKKEKEALEFIKAQKESGKINELAVQQFTAQYYNLIVIEKEVLQNIRKEENKLNFLLGRYPQAINRSKENLYGQQNLINKSIPSTVLQNRADIKAAEWKLKASKFDLNAAKAAFYPTFALNMGYGFQAFNANYWLRTPESIAYNVAGNLMAPLVNRSAIKAQFNAAKSAQVESMYQYQQSILNAYVDVVNDFTELSHLEDIKKITENKANSYKQAVESSFDLYKAARVPYIDVLLSQQNALQSNIELILIHKRSKIAMVKLYKNLGGQW
jgi:outer membrane protein, multidrug efflux system